MKVTALEGSTDPAFYDDAAIEAWQADNLTLSRIDVTSVQPALYAGAPDRMPASAGFVTNLQIHGARMQSMTNSALLIRNGTGRLTDVLAVAGKLQRTTQACVSSRGATPATSSRSETSPPSAGPAAAHGRCLDRRRIRPHSHRHWP